MWFNPKVLKPTVLLAAGVLFSGTALAGNGFADFDDAELVDRLAVKVAREYARDYRFTFEFKWVKKDEKRLSPFLVQYMRAQKKCIYWISPKEEAWHSFENYLKFFEGLPKQVVYEAFFAHESGHCVQQHEDIDFGMTQRGSRQELFADLFALSHVERHYPQFRKPFQAALVNMRKVEMGFRSSYDFAGELIRFSHRQDFQSMLRLPEAGERAFMMAKVVDQL